MLEIYNDALIRFVSQIRWGGKAIPVVLAGADRAYAQIREWLKTQRNIEISLSAGEAAIPYPFIAVWREMFQDNEALASLGIHRVIDRPDIGFGYAMRHPKAVKARCEINIYCANKSQAEYIELQAKGLFIHKQSWIPVDFNDPRWYQPPNDVFSYAKILGVQNLLLDEENLVDNSSLEEGGLRQREIRMTWGISMHGWIPYQPYIVPAANKLAIEVYEQTSGELLVKGETDES